MVKERYIFVHHAKLAKKNDGKLVGHQKKMLAAYYPVSGLVTYLMNGKEIVTITEEDRESFLQKVISAEIAMTF